MSVIPRATPAMPTQPQLGASQHVFIAMILAFLLYGLANEVFTTEKSKVGTETTDQFLRRYAAWGILFFVLMVGAEIEVTAGLSVAFAWLIALYMFLNNGTFVFNKLIDIMNSGAPVDPHQQA